MCNYYGGYSQPSFGGCNATVVCAGNAGVTTLPGTVAGAGAGEEKKPGLCFILVLFILLALICNVVGADNGYDDEDDDCCDCCDCDCY